VRLDVVGLGGLDQGVRVSARHGGASGRLVRSPHRWFRDSSCQSADISRNLGQVVIELMVAAFESADNGVRNGSRIQV